MSGLVVGSSAGLPLGGFVHGFGGRCVWKRSGHDQPREGFIPRYRVRAFIDYGLFPGNVQKGWVAVLRLGFECQFDAVLKQLLEHRIEHAFWNDLASSPGCVFH